MSVLDRLVDHDPRKRLAPDQPVSHTISDLKDALQRDVEWLLNTRQIPDLPDESLKEVNRSVYVFGVPDFTAFSMASPKEQSKLLRSIQAVLRTFEPRIKNLRVVELGSPDIRTRTLRLRIEGQLQVDPAPVDVFFDTLLQLSSGKHEVKHA